MPSSPNSPPTTSRPFSGSASTLTSRFFFNCMRGPTLIKVLLYLAPYLLQVLFLPHSLLLITIGVQLFIHALIMPALWWPSVLGAVRSLWLLDGIYLYSLLGYYGFYTVWKDRQQWREQFGHPGFSRLGDLHGAIDSMSNYNENFAYKMAALIVIFASACLRFYIFGNLFLRPIQIVHQAPGPTNEPDDQPESGRLVQLRRPVIAVTSSEAATVFILPVEGVASERASSHPPPPKYEDPPTYEEVCGEAANSSDRVANGSNTQ